MEKDCLEVRLRKIVCAEYGISEEMFSSSKRQRIIVDAKQMLMRLLYHEAHYKIMDIARFMKYGHANTIYAINKVHDLLKFDRKTKAHYDNILATLAPCFESN